MVVPGILDSKAPLIVQLHLTNSLGAPRAVDFTGAGVTLFSGAVVLDTAAIAHQVITRRLAVSVVARAKLNNAVALVLSNALHSTQQILKAAVDALGRRSEGARLAGRHGSGGNGRRSGGCGGRGELTRGAQRTRRAVGDDNARGDGRVVRILLERNFDGIVGQRRENERTRASLRSRVALDDDDVRVDAGVGVGVGVGVGRAGAGSAVVVDRGGRRASVDTVDDALFRRCWWCKSRFSRY
ncbi:hypothetical protein F4802DRAFT_164041 [Xylaria palmicola]|nr:hypothetical protein F4802DRAFT_164041 [Xylaria palmicola]